MHILCARFFPNSMNITNAVMSVVTILIQILPIIIFRV